MMTSSNAGSERCATAAVVAGGGARRAAPPFDMNTFSTAWDRAQRIDGWLTEGQARLLFDAARRAPAGQTIVEIGCHHGRSTVILATAKATGVRLLAVDPYGDERWGGGSE